MISRIKHLKLRITFVFQTLTHRYQSRRVLLAWYVMRKTNLLKASFTQATNFLVVLQRNKNGAFSECSWLSIHISGVTCLLLFMGYIFDRTWTRGYSLFSSLRLILGRGEKIGQSHITNSLHGVPSSSNHRTATNRFRSAKTINKYFQKPPLFFLTFMSISSVHFLMNHLYGR